MTTLEALQAANPQYQILTVDDPSFRQFGVCYPQYDLTTIKQAMASIPV